MEPFRYIVETKMKPWQKNTINLCLNARLRIELINRGVCISSDNIICITYHHVLTACTVKCTPCSAMLCFVVCGYIGHVIYVYYIYMFGGYLCCIYVLRLYWGSMWYVYFSRLPSIVAYGMVPTYTKTQQNANRADILSLYTVAWICYITGAFKVSMNRYSNLRIQIWHSFNSWFYASNI